MKKFGWWMVVVALSSFAFPIAAQKDQSFVFDDEVVDGDMANPLGEVLQTRKIGTRHSLLEIRKHFVAEVLQSIENI